jgi:streptogrisin C
MARPGFVRGLAVTVVLVGIAAAGAAPAAAEPRPGSAQQAGTEPVAATMRAAMERDLGLTAAQVDRLLLAGERAYQLNARLRARLGDELAGSWFDHQAGSLRVAVTDRAAAELARAAGAAPVLVRHSARELAAITEELDALVAADPAALPGVFAWGVDARTNQVVVTVRAGQAGEAAGLVSEYGDAVRVEESAHEPQLTQEFPRLDGGIPYNGCSTGFNMTAPDGTAYILTAGHCGPAGTVAVASNGVTIGPVVESVWPTSDHALIRVTNRDAWVPSPFVWTWPGTIRPTGFFELFQGWPVCKSGRTTGWTCGLILALNETVVLAGGFVVHDLTRHAACAEPGDSGGPNLTQFMFGSVLAQGTSTAASLLNGQCLAKSGQGNQSWYFPTSVSIPYYNARYGVTLNR